MSSSQPAPATPAESSPSRRTQSHFEAFGVKLPLPRWAIVSIGILATLGTGASVILKYLPLSALGSSDAQATKLPDKPSSKISDAEMIQYREAWNHRDHTPRIDKEVPLSTDLGSLRIKFFISDGCVQITRTSPGNPQGVSIYVPEASIRDQAPGKIHASATQAYGAVGGSNSIQPAMMLASFVPAGIAVATETGCLDPHPGEFRWWNGETRGCWLQVWRAWPDGCQHYQWFNTCNGYWDNLPNGAPKVYWTSCNH